jgi:hypothetical protein
VTRLYKERGRRLIRIRAKLLDCKGEERSSETGLDVIEL